MSRPGRFEGAEVPVYLDRVPSPDDCARCWYCGAPLAPRHEHDHVTPRACGGTIMVAACMNCHELKDRTLVEQWDATVTWRAVQAVPDAGPPRDLLVSTWGVMTGDRPAAPLDERALIDVLAATPQAEGARLLLGKLAATVLQAEHTPASA